MANPTEDDKHIQKWEKQAIREKDDSMISKRPWHTNAKELEYRMPDGSTERRWTMTVNDADGNIICFGDSADMEFIVEMEHAYTDSKSK